MERSFPSIRPASIVDNDIDSGVLLLCKVPNSLPVGLVCYVGTDVAGLVASISYQLFRPICGLSSQP
jgi:hypothetical protein